MLFVEPKGSLHWFQYDKEKKVYLNYSGTVVSTEEWEWNRYVYADSWRDLYKKIGYKPPNACW